MKTVTMLALGAISLSACATDGRSTLVERGYDRGDLAVAAIDRRDWSQAEQLLLDKNGASADDPARLINLGKVYMETGRTGAALSAWRLALASDRHFMAETMDGRRVSTREVAQLALSRYEPDGRSAGR